MGGTVSVDSRLRAVVAAVFGLIAEQIQDDASPRNIETWDSVGHIHLVLAVEEEFGLQFDPDEIPDLASVGAIRARLERSGAG